MMKILEDLLRYYQLMESIDAGNDAEAMLLNSEDELDHAVLGELSGIRAQLGDLVFVEGYPPDETDLSYEVDDEHCPICRNGMLGEEIITVGESDMLLLTCNIGCEYQWMIPYKEDNPPES